MRSKRKLWFLVAVAVAIFATVALWLGGPRSADLSAGSRDAEDTMAPPTIPAPTITPQADNITVQTPTPEPSPPAIALLPPEDPPRGAEREFTTAFERHTIPYDEVLSGGPPKDGIPAIDNPAFVSIVEASEWLADREPVILLEWGSKARAYPLQVLTWHEIVNDVIDGQPIVVTFCPLCNTAIAFRAEHEGQALDFGTTGRLRYSNLIMYDRQTETWWQQATGEGIAGRWAGEQLETLPAQIIAWEAFARRFPDGQVLSRETGHGRSYGMNPYAGYDDVDETPFLFAGPPTPGQLAPMERVATVELAGEAVAYPYALLEQIRVVNDTVAGQAIAVFWQPGTASALDTSAISQGRDVGAVSTFSRRLGERTLTFVWDGESIRDEETASSWDIFGEALEGPLVGERLEAVVNINHFWFSWAAFRPDTRIYERD